MALTKTEIVAQWGAYYLASGQNLKSLKNALLQKGVTASMASPRVTENDIYQTSTTTMGEIIQGFQKGWTEKGDVVFTANEIPLRNVKFDLSFYPDELKESWLGFLVNINEAERTKWPLIKWLLEVKIPAQIQHDMETKVYGKGVYAAPTPGTASTAAATMDGIKKKVDLGLASGKMTAVTLSAPITAANAFDMIEEYVDQLPEEFKNENIVIQLNPTILRWYLRDKRNTHGGDTNYSDKKAFTIDFAENIKFQALPSLSGVDYVISTLADNFVHINKTTPASINVEESKREVNIMGDWKEAIGYEYDEAVFAYKPV